MTKSKFAPLTSLLVSALMGLCAATAQAATPAPAPSTALASTAAACPAILKHQFNRLQDEAPQNLCPYAGKVTLVVNTASYCGFTSQYQGLEDLFAKYQSKGLVVLGFPSNVAPDSKTLLAAIEKAL